MYLKSSNPQIDELTKTHKERRINLSNLDLIKLDDRKLCVWCLSPLKGRQYKWCSRKCATNAWAWANPQKEAGLQILLVRQEFKCLSCKYDYLPHLLEIAKNPYYKRFSDVSKIKLEFSTALMRRLKEKVGKNLRPEVDHVIPISKGGEPIGFSNHQILCFSCHKIKSKHDNSGPRKKK